MIHREDRDGVAVLRLDHGKVNALDTELLGELQEQLVGLARAEGGVVLTGTGSVFSAGLDLFRLLEGGADYVRRLLAALDAGLRYLLELPRPVVAAINGHAIAGGCVLAAACDHRVMSADAGRIGVTELLVGVPFPASAFEVVRGLLAPHHANRVITSGQTLVPAEALACGLIDGAVPGPQVLDRACAVARQLAAAPAAAFAICKRQLRAPVLEAIARTAVLDTAVHAVWEDPGTQAAIRRYLQATVGRSR
jgi:enoyl-CoA hydratase